MRDLKNNSVALLLFPVDTYPDSVTPYFADVDLNGQARRLTLAMDVKLGSGADIDIEIVQTDTAPGSDEETILTDTITTDGAYGVDFTPTKRYVTVYLTVNTDDCLVSCAGFAYLLRQIPESQAQVQVL